jgi:hypothetical protein
MLMWDERKGRPWLRTNSIKAGMNGATEVKENGNQ